MGPLDRMIHEERREDRKDRREEAREDRLDRREERHEDRRDAILDRREDHLDRREDRLERRDDYNDTDHNGHSDSPVFHPGRPTRILISPGHGAGWITWAPRGTSDAFLVWMLTYEPLVRALEEHRKKDRLEDIIHDFHKEARNRYGVERLNIARAGDIEVRDVDYPFQVREKDGSEWIEDITRLAGGVGGRRHINF